MKRIIILIGIILVSLSSFGQTKLTKYIKGEWESRTECMIATKMSEDGSVKLYLVRDNILFPIESKEQ